VIVITGAAGFIGSHLAEGLAEKGFRDLVLVDDFSIPEKKANWSGLVYQALVHRDDFFDWIQQHHRQVQYVFHLGARTNTLEQDEEVLNRLNFEYSQHVWEHCVRFGLPMCYASSAATYGDGSLGFDDNLSIIHQLQPLNPYGWSKHRFDLWALEQKRKPVQWVGLKFFNVYGNRENHKGRMASVVLHAYQQIASTQELKLFKSYRNHVPDGEQKRDFVFVKDLVIMMISIMLDRGVTGIFNAGTGRARSFNELSTVIFGSLGLPEKVVYVDMPDVLQKQYQYFTEANMISFFKKKSLIFTPIEGGISEYVRELQKENSPSVI
jgi:ADP-L-glycero-D-manno-heptose 6-epimerase